MKRAGACETSSDFFLAQPISVLDFLGKVFVTNVLKATIDLYLNFLGQRVWMLNGVSLQGSTSPLAKLVLFRCGINSKMLGAELSRRAWALPVEMLRMLFGTLVQPKRVRQLWRVTSQQPYRMP